MTPTIREMPSITKGTGNPIASPMMRPTKRMMSKISGLVIKSFPLFPNRSYAAGGEAEMMDAKLFPLGGIRTPSESAMVAAKSANVSRTPMFTPPWMDDPVMRTGTYSRE